MPGTNQERRGRSTKNGTSTRKPIPELQRNSNPGNSNPGTSTRKPLPENRALDLRNSNPGTSHGTNPEMRMTSTNILDHQGSNTGTSINLGRTIVITLQVTRGTLGRDQEEQTGVAIVKKMTIGTSRGAITLKNIVKSTETSPGSIKEMTTPAANQGMIQDQGIGNHPGIGTGKEDRGREVRAPEDRGREVTALEVVEGEVMETEEVMLAMGAEVENVARRP